MRGHVTVVVLLYGNLEGRPRKKSGGKSRSRSRSRSHDAEKDGDKYAVKDGDKYAETESTITSGELSITEEVCESVVDAIELIKN